MDANDNFNEHEFRNFVHDLPFESIKGALTEVVIVKCTGEIKMMPDDGYDVATGCNKIALQAFHCIGNAFTALLKPNASEWQI